MQQTWRTGRATSTEELRWKASRTQLLVQWPQPTRPTRTKATWTTRWSEETLGWKATREAIWTKSTGEDERRNSFIVPYAAVFFVQIFSLVAIHGEWNRSKLKFYCVFVDILLAEVWAVLMRSSRGCQAQNHHIYIAKIITNLGK